MEWLETRGVSPCRGDKSSPWQGVYPDNSVPQRCRWHGHVLGTGPRGGACRAVRARCGPRAPAVVTGLASSQASSGKGHSDPLGPLGINGLAFGEPGRAGRRWQPPGLGMGCPGSDRPLLMIQSLGAIKAQLSQLCHPWRGVPLWTRRSFSKSPVVGLSLKWK